MKHVIDFPFEDGLPDAPLPMPKQDLEPRLSLMQAIRAALWPFTDR